jgi:hypothetical protein
MVTMDILSTKADSTDIAFRGYDTIPCKFAVNIYDHFGNSSGMIYPENEYVIPLYETILDKKIQRAMSIAGDATWDHWEGRMAYLIDDNVQTLIHSDNNTMPGASITLDIGKKAKLSRMLAYQRQDRPDEMLYWGGNIRVFEVYSSDDDSDSPNGDWSGWTLRNVCTVIRPSDIGGTREEDRLAAEAGHEFSLPLDMPPVRYIRIKFLTNWENVSYSYMGELTLFGVYE